jgi:hypothetical protein
MNEKINQLINEYSNTLKRKQRLMQPHIDKKNESFEDWNIKDQEEYSRLYSECEMLKKHIDDLMWILEK